MDLNCLNLRWAFDVASKMINNTWRISALKFAQSYGSIWYPLITPWCPFVYGWLMSLTTSSKIGCVFTNIDQRVFKLSKTVHYFFSQNTGVVCAIFPARLVPPCFFVSFGATIVVHFVVSTGKPRWNLILSRLQVIKNQKGNKFKGIARSLPGTWEFYNRLSSRKTS